MRILFVAPYLPSLIRVRPYNLLRELAGRHEVTLLATDRARKLAEADAIRPFCQKMVLVPLRKWASLLGCGTAALQGDPLQSGFCRSRELERAFRDLVGSRTFDLVHVEHLRAAHLAWHIPDGIPSLYDSVDCISLLLGRTMQSSHSLKQRVLAAMELQRTRGYEARLLRRFDRIAVTSPADRLALLSLAPEAQVTVVPNGVDLEYFRMVGGPRDAATLVFSGKMSYHANVTALLYFMANIFPLVRAARPDVRLLVVGSDPPPSVRALGCDRSITVTGHLADIRPALSRATIAICPMIVKAGIQNKLLEAMAMSLPVVATSNAVQGLSVAAGRDLLVADDPAEFASHVCRLLNSPALRQRIGLAARGFVELHHRWDAAARMLESLYVGAVEQRSGRQVKCAVG